MFKDSDPRYHLARDLLGGFLGLPPPIAATAAPSAVSDILVWALKSVGSLSAP